MMIKIREDWKEVHGASFLRAPTHKIAPKPQEARRNEMNRTDAKCISFLTRAVPAGYAKTDCIPKQ